MALVLLIRHALTDSTGHRLTGSAGGVHLSEEGRAQAAALAERLSVVPLAAVYASPLERCMETAEAVAGPRGLEVRPVPEAGEVDFGRWTGRALSQLRRTSLWKDVQVAPSSVRFPGGESVREVQRRIVDAVDGLAERHPRAAIAVVSHAEPLRLLIAHHAGIHLDLFQRVVVGPASVSALFLGRGGPRILRLNDTGSVADLVPKPGTRRGGRPRARAAAGRGNTADRRPRGL